MTVFKDNFSKLEVCHLGHGSLEAGMEVHGKKRLEETLFVGEWVKNSTAGGCANFPGVLVFHIAFLRSCSLSSDQSLFFNLLYLIGKLYCVGISEEPYKSQ